MTNSQRVCVMCGTPISNPDSVQIAINDWIIADLRIQCFHDYDYTTLQVEAGDTLTIETPVKVISEVLTEG